MQKIVSVNIVRPMIPIIKSKINTKIQRRVKELIEIENAKKYFKKTIDVKELEREVRREMNLSCDIHFIHELEICSKLNGDILMTANEIELLNSLYEEIL